MSNDPDVIRAQIEATRAELSNDVNELSEKVSPAKIAERQTAKLREGVMAVKEHIMGAADDVKSSTGGVVSSVKEHIMGAADNVKSSTGGVVSSVKEHIMGAADDAKSSTGDGMSSGRGAMSSVGDVVSSAGDAVAAAPRRVAQQAKGNPMAAGLIAFGLGVLAASLVPASKAEAKVGATLKGQVTPLVQQVTSVAKEAAGNMQEPAQQALESLKSTATDAVGALKEEGASAASEVKDQAQSAKSSVQEHASGS